MNVQPTTHLCTYVMHPSRIVGLVFEGIVNRVRACWQWVAHSQYGAVAIRSFQESSYIQPLDRTDKSVLQTICVLALVIPVGGRLYFGPAPTPLLAFTFVAFLSGGYRLMKNRREFTLNQQVVARIPTILATVRHAVDYRTPYSQTLNVFKNLIDDSRFSHLKPITGNFEGYRRQFEEANGRRPLDGPKTRLFDYLGPVIATFPQGSDGNVRCNAFRTAVNNLVTNDAPQEEFRARRAEFQASYEALSTIQLNQQDRHRITRRKDRVEEALNQPSYERCRRDLIGWMERFQTKIEERLPWWKVVFPFPDPEPLE